jgi:hypothetical protein
MLVVRGRLEKEVGKRLAEGVELRILETVLFSQPVPFRLDAVRQ